MTQRESISRCLIILNRLKNGPASYSDIANKLRLESELQGYNFNVSKRTFQRDLDNISSLYSIEIKFDFSRRVYFICSDEQPGINERMMDAFNTFNALNLSGRFSEYISLERGRATGSEHIFLLLLSVKEKRQISFTYNKFNDEDTSVRIVEPYGLKEFRNRLYLVAKDTKDDMIKTFALDRLTEPLPVEKKFRYPEGFSIVEYFMDCFGIIKPVDEEVENVILSFDPVQGGYIKSLPLHSSQKILTDNDERLRISLRLYITFDFIMELLSFGQRVTVEMPMSLAEELMISYRNSLNHY